MANINIDHTLGRIFTIIAIVDRANSMGIARGDRITQIMDMDIAAEQCEGMDLDLMLSFDDFNFAHDFIGIQNHMDRENCRFIDLFLPRCARGKGVE